MPRPAYRALRVFLVAVLAASAIVPAAAGRRPRQPPPPPPSPGGGDPGGPETNPASACGALSAAEVTGLLNAAAAAVGFPTLAIAMVDRPGNVLGLYLQGSPPPAPQA